MANFRKKRIKIVKLIVAKYLFLFIGLIGTIIISVIFYNEMNKIKLRDKYSSEGPEALAKRLNDLEELGKMLMESQSILPHFEDKNFFAIALEKIIEILTF